MEMEVEVWRSAQPWVEGVDTSGGAGEDSGKRGKRGEAVLVGCQGGSAGGVGE